MLMWYMAMLTIANRLAMVVAAVRSAYSSPRRRQSMQPVKIQLPRKARHDNAVPASYSFRYSQQWFKAKQPFEANPSGHGETDAMRRQQRRHKDCR